MTKYYIILYDIMWSNKKRPKKCDQDLQSPTGIHLWTDKKVVWVYGVCGVCGVMSVNVIFFYSPGVFAYFCSRRTRQPPRAPERPGRRWRMSDGSHGSGPLGRRDG